MGEDLAWEGSEYAVLSRNETRFLGAMGAYSRGEEPIMSDDEFDALKASLKAQGSIVACSTEPRCFLDTGICSVTFTPDRFRGLVLYLPAISVLTLLWTGGTYELVSASRGLNPLITLLIGSPLIVSVAQYLTEQVLFKDPFIAGAVPRLRRQQPPLLRRHPRRRGIPDRGRRPVLQLQDGAQSEPRHAAGELQKGAFLGV